MVKWNEFQQNVKGKPTETDYTLNIDAMGLYSVLGGKILTIESNSVSLTEDELTEAQDLLHKLNYQKLQQVLRYVNDIRHGKHSNIGNLSR
jgi:hypothetical protein